MIVTIVDNDVSSFLITADFVFRGWYTHCSGSTVKG
jgi:hypothetical protein